MDSWSQVAKLETKLTEKLSRPKEELVARTSTTQSEISMSSKLSSEHREMAEKPEPIKSKNKSKKTSKKSSETASVEKKLSLPETAPQSPKASFSSQEEVVGKNSADEEEPAPKKSAKKSKKKSKTVVDTKSSPETTEVSSKASSDELTSKSATGLKATKKRQQNK